MLMATETQMNMSITLRASKVKTNMIHGKMFPQFSETEHLCGFRIKYIEKSCADRILMPEKTYFYGQITIHIHIIT